MQLPKDWITGINWYGTYSKFWYQGHGIRNNNPKSMIEVPDHWFIKVVGNSGKPAIGKKYPMHVLSRQGFKENEREIENIIISEGKITWFEFEKAAKKFFDKMRRAAEKERAKLQNLLDELEQALADAY